MAGVASAACSLVDSSSMSIEHDSAADPATFSEHSSAEPTLAAAEPTLAAAEPVATKPI